MLDRFLTYATHVGTNRQEPYDVGLFFYPILHCSLPPMMPMGISEKNNSRRGIIPSTLIESYQPALGFRTPVIRNIVVGHHVGTARVILGKRYIAVKRRIFV